MHLSLRTVLKYSTDSVSNFDRLYKKTSDDVFKKSKRICEESCGKIRLLRRRGNVRGQVSSLNFFYISDSILVSTASSDMECSAVDGMLQGVRKGLERDSKVWLITFKIPAFAKFLSMIRFENSKVE